MKRLLDIVLSLLALVFLSPIIVFLYILVAWKLGSPVLFVQQRPGKKGRLFNMMKFRSMTGETDASGVLSPDEQRLTAFGKLLRSISLDELPGFWSVLKGDMSLVGPRPLLVEYLQLYSKEQARRHDVKPGITGWAQVNGRNALSWEQKFKLDVWYVDNQSFWLDLKILWLTVKKVLIRDGVSVEGGATMTKFTGSIMQRLAILGASGHGKVVAEIAELTGWSETVFFDDAFPRITQIEAWNIEGNTNDLLSRVSEFDGCIVAIGDNAIRFKKTMIIQKYQGDLVSLIHPASVVSHYADIELGTVVMAGAVINPFAKLGVACIVNTMASIDHDCDLKSGVHISPGAHIGGAVAIGQNSWVGIGASIKQGLCIGDNAIVGAGAAVVDNVPSNVVVVGLPAKNNNNFDYIC